MTLQRLAPVAGELSDAVRKMAVCGPAGVEHATRRLRVDRSATVTLMESQLL